MPSQAGHYARDIAKKVPSGLVFIPSRDGLSHVPEEFTDFKLLCEPPYTERYVRWCEGTVDKLIIFLSLD